MNKLEWEFAPTGGGDVTGVNDPVTSIFRGRGDLSYHLARESIQNVIDAKVNNTLEPARAHFSLLSLQPSNFPGFNELKEVLKSCRDADLKNKDSYETYSRLIEQISRDRFVQVMKISDYNTTGLTGDDEDQNGNYFSLMKAVGSTSKSGAAGGSWGLGKGAYFAASSFRTIFVSSVYDQNKMVFQGKARLRSFLKDGKIMQGNGSFGLPEQKPIREIGLIPSFLNREEQGTDIYIVGYDDPENWEETTIKSVLNNFWCSIIKGTLEVSVDDTNITEESLEGLLRKHFNEDEPDKTDSPNPWPYYQAYVNDSAKEFEEKLPTLGYVQLYLMEGENYPNKIAYIRKTGMVIDKKSYSAPLNYAGVFICENDKGNEILKKMENPAHAEWKKENARGSKFEKDAEEAEKEIRSFLRKSVNSLFISESKGSLEVGGLEEFLWLEGDLSIGGLFGQEVSEDISESETGPEVGKDTRESAYVPITREVSVIREVVKGTPGGEGPIIGGNGNGGQTGSGQEDEEGDENVEVLKDVKFRTFAVKNPDGLIEHVIIIRGPADKECLLEFKAGTDDSFDEVVIRRAFADDMNYEVSKNKIEKVKIGPSGETRLRVLFSDNERYSLNIKAYANK